MSGFEFYFGILEYFDLINNSDEASPDKKLVRCGISIDLIVGGARPTIEEEHADIRLG